MTRINTAVIVPKWYVLVRVPPTTGTQEAWQSRPAYLNLFTHRLEVMP